jgi:FKBP-type peptidyl-prolyl cis-trans isomerase
MKIKALQSLLAIAVIAIFVGCNSKPDASKVVLKDKIDSISYVIGLDYGAGLKNRMVEYNSEAIYKGIVDYRNEVDLFPDSVKIALITEVNQEINENILEDFNVKLAERKQQGAEFLEQNKLQEGVVELPSGLQYKIISAGATNRTPAATDSVIVHYKTLFTDGTLIEETYGGVPAGFRLTNLNRGLSEGIQMMNPGGIYEFYIPSNLSFEDKHFVDQESGRVIIPAGSTLIYRVELINITN